MARVIEQGFDEYFVFLDKLSEKKRHELTVVNGMKYAVYLQDRYGYYVFNNGEMLRFANKHFGLMLQAGTPATTENVQRALEAAAIDYINFLRSHTKNMRPPARKDGAARFAHPGGWADVTGNLTKAYWFMVNGRRFNQ